MKVLSLCVLNTFEKQIGKEEYISRTSAYSINGTVFCHEKTAP